MKRNRTRMYKLKNRLVTKDREGVPIISYTSEKDVKAEIWAARDQLQVATYGDRTNNILNMRLYGKYTAYNDGSMAYDLGDFVLRAGDGACIYDETPDYKVISIRPYQHLVLELEKL